MFELIKDHVKNDADLAFEQESAESGGIEAVTWSITNTGGTAFCGVIRLLIPLPPGFTDPCPMVPGFIYGENRRINQRGSKIYPRWDPAAETPDAMTSNWWDFGADRTAAPLVFWHQNKHCFAAASRPHYRTEGDVFSDDAEPQMGVGFAFDGREGYVRFNIPACQEPFTYSNQPDNSPTVWRITIPPDASVEGSFYVYRFDGGRHGYQHVMEDYYRRMQPEHPAAELPETGPLVADAAHGVVAGHYHAEKNYFIYSRPYDPVIEQIGNGRGITTEWHQMMTGFVNGLPVCRGLLNAASLTGDDRPRQVAVRVADRICSEGVSPSGFFWADYTPESVETANGRFPNPVFKGRSEWGSGWLPGGKVVHSRTIADACDHLAGMIAQERRWPAPAPSLPLWKRALESNLLAALDLQLSDGRFGQIYDAVQRKVAKEDGCGGLLWIPAMIKAENCGVGGEKLSKRMRDAVLRAGDGYAPYVEEEYIWGAPEDNDSPTSEDGMNAVTAYCDLYETSGEKRFLSLAQRAADWMLTFRKTYNERLPEQSLMGRYGMRSQGGDFASVSNNHLHVFEALCTRHLCNLSRWTGNAYYRDRARDHWAFVCQHLSRCDGMYNGFRGAMAEQFYWCNYGSWRTWRPPANHRQKGNMAPFTAVWCIAVILLAAPDAACEFYGQNAGG